MHGSADHPATGRRNANASCPGVDRIAWIRVVLLDGRPAICRVHGTRHRRPVVVTVSAAAARALIDAGVPALIREKRAA